MSKKIIVAMLAMLAISGCTNQREDLKSPCVGADGSPCDRRPVNVG